MQVRQKVKASCESDLLEEKRGEGIGRDWRLEMSPLPSREGGQASVIHDRVVAATHHGLEERFVGSGIGSTIGRARARG